MKSKKWLKFAIYVVTTASVFALGCCFLFGCINIYNSGLGFSAQAVNEQLNKYNILIYMSVILITVGSIALYCLDLGVKKTTLKSDNTLSMLNMLRRKTDYSLNQAVIREQRLQLFLNISGYVLFVLAFVVSIAKTFSIDYTVGDINATIASLSMFCFICFIIPFVWCVVSYYLCKASKNREISLLKILPRMTTIKPKKSVVDTKRLLVIRIFVCIVSVCFIIAGILGNGVSDILTKAVNICTECIGLG